VGTSLTPDEVKKRMEAAYEMARQVSANCSELGDDPEVCKLHCHWYDVCRLETRKEDWEKLEGKEE